jgi:hypothetical protein
MGERLDVYSSAHLIYESYIFRHFRMVRPVRHTLNKPDALFGSTRLFLRAAVALNCFRGGRHVVNRLQTCTPTLRRPFYGECAVRNSLTFLRLGVLALLATLLFPSLSSAQKQSCTSANDTCILFYESVCDPPTLGLDTGGCTKWASNICCGGGGGGSAGPVYPTQPAQCCGTLKCTSKGICICSALCKKGESPQ